ncbi:MAG TPA: MarR family transcriptional regulator [Bacillota bacterium]|nr:MarR family transcriptional regulator [Bacillota bacterium]
MAWLGLVHVHGLLVREIDAALITRHGLSLNGFEVLFHLTRTPGERLAMAELVRLVVLSPSGLSRLLARLERDGLVARHSTPEDARAMAVSLTEAGRAALAAAADTHLQVLRSRFLSHLSAEEVDQLAGLWLRVDPTLAGLGCV